MPWKNKPLVVYVNDEVDYYLFVDESGDHILKNRDSNNNIFTVAGVIIEKNSYLKIEDEINKLKNKYWDNGNYKEKNKYLKKVCFVNRNIRRRQKAFMEHYLDDNAYNNFLEDLTSLMQKQDYNIIATCIDKTELFTKYQNTKKPYNLAMELLVEKFVRFLYNKNATGLIMMEARGKKEDSELHQYFLDIYNNGIKDLSYKIFSKTITGGFYFNGKWNQEKNNMETFCGLEFADLVAHPIGNFAKTGDRTIPFKTFEDKFLENGLEFLP